VHAIVLFLKHPEPGRVKTRLAATVGSARATEIYREMVQQVCSGLPKDAVPIVMFDPPEQETAMRDWLSPMLRADALFIPQGPGDLGARIAHGFETAFAAGFSRVAAIGSDCIDVTPAIYAEAFSKLDEFDVVFGPAWDGGYYLVALSRPIPAIFRNVRWSSERTLADSLCRASELGITACLLEKRHDIDTEEDWLRAVEPNKPK
jgi:rSAM/selenodomain-associated transferase 1